MPQVFSSYVESQTGRLVRAVFITGPLETLDGVRTYQEDWADCKTAPSPSDFIGDVLLTDIDGARRIVTESDLNSDHLPGGAGPGRVWSPEFKTPEGQPCFIASQRWMCCCEAAAILLGSRWADAPGDSFLLYPGGPQPTGRAVELVLAEADGIRLASNGEAIQGAIWNSYVGGLMIGLLPTRIEAIAA